MSQSYKRFALKIIFCLLQPKYHLFFTIPENVSPDEIFLANSDKSVVLPAPEGPIIASM